MWHDSFPCVIFKPNLPPIKEFEYNPFKGDKLGFISNFFKVSMKGVIALDIDGTITPFSQPIPQQVIAYFSHLVKIGWRLIFITGRTFHSSYETLHVLPFPFYLAVQNGAIILEMPLKKIISKKYLDHSILSAMEEICKSEPSDFVIYGGFEEGDVCFYRPQFFSSFLLSYLQKRIKSFDETWYAVESYSAIKLVEFPSVKCFGDYSSALLLADKIEKVLGLHAPVIRDPFNDRYYVVQATHPQISKGQALRDLTMLMKNGGKVIAAGDDLNDQSMLEFADIKVVMSSAPESLKKIADVIAPPASEQGIIAGLEAAINS